MSAKVINMAGEDITPQPLTIEQQFLEDMLNWLQSMPLEQVEEKIKQKYQISCIE